MELDFGLRLLVAVALGLALGLERELTNHPAGMRTMALISGGAALFTMIGTSSFGHAGVDPTRIAAQVVTGVGFLGAGAILRQGASVKGLTSAAAIWIVAAIGMAAGFGHYGIAIVATLLVLATLTAIRPVERYLVHRTHHGVESETTG